jgi:hypothetical protein
VTPLLKFKKKVKLNFNAFFEITVCILGVSYVSCWANAYSNLPPLLLNFKVAKLCLGISPWAMAEIVNKFEKIIKFHYVIYRMNDCG